MRNWKILWMVCLSGLYGCAHTLQPVEAPDSTNATAEFDSLKLDMRNAQEKQLDVLAPESYDKAEDYFNRAQGDVSKSDDKRTLEDIGYARAYLNQAKDQGTFVQTSVPDLVKSREQALHAGAQHYQGDMDNADGQFKSISANILDSKQPDPKDLGALENRYLALELKAIKESKLGSVRGKVSEAKNEGAEKYAPKSYQLAQERLDAADKTIETDRHDSARIDQAVYSADLAASHCLETVALARNAEGKSPEEIAMELEARDTQWAQTQRSAEVAREQVGDEDAVIAAQSAQLRQERQKSDEMAGIVALNQDLDSARRKFSDQEAEVYRQGDNLVIQLKGMKFKPGSNDIPEGSIATLRKVQQVIEDLQPEKVVVQGHTDATGTSSKNKALSEERAASVAQFFQGTEGLVPGSIEHAGLGDSKPIASNKTVEGRAENRRVDIILETGTPGYKVYKQE